MTSSRILAVAAALAAMPVPALADQFKMAADNAKVECVASRRDLTRISLVGDQFAGLQKMAGGSPYNDFSVVNEPVRGDIYLSVPEGFAPAAINFFATTKKGYVYKFVCQVQDTEAQQVFVTNPALAEQDARQWEDETPLRSTAVRLIQAMATNATVEGYRLRQPAGMSSNLGPLGLTLIAEYRGAQLLGKSIRITNRSSAPVTLSEAALAPTGTLAVTFASPTLAAGESTMMWLVGPNGGE
jgi:conjugal transfer pilus assembly protein TraK